MNEPNADYGAMVKASVQTSLRGNNPFILVVGSIAVTFISVVTVGLLTGPAAVGLARASLVMNRGETPSFDDLKAGLRSFVPSFVAGLLVWLSVAVGSVLLVVPGVVAAFVSTYTFHVLAEHPDTTGVQAVKDSFAVVKDNPATTVVFWVIALIVLGVFSLIPVVGTVVGIALTFALAAKFYPGVVHIDRSQLEHGAPTVESSVEPPSDASDPLNPSNP